MTEKDHGTAFDYFNAECTFEPKGEHGLEGFSLGEVYNVYVYPHREPGKCIYDIWYYDTNTTKYRRQGSLPNSYRLFTKYFTRIKEENQKAS